jgi:ribosomal protein S27AE
MKIHSLKCVNCGAALEVKQDIENFACGYCGVQQQVERSGGIIALSRIEAALEGVQSGTARAASELAVARLQADVWEICRLRDSQVGVLRAADDKNNVMVGWAIIIGVIAAISLFGWWSIPVVIAGLYFGSRFIKSVSREVKAVEANAQARIEPLKLQIAHHQSIIDAYDLGHSAQS